MNRVSLATASEPTGYSHTQGTPRKDSHSRDIGRVPRLAACVYVCLAFIGTVVVTIVVPDQHQAAIQPGQLIPPVALYTILRIVYLAHWYRDNTLSRVLLVVDAVLASLLLLLTGGLRSPFMLYSMAPVMTASLLANKKVTVGITGLTIGAMLVAQFAHPLSPPGSPQIELYLLYIATMCLTAILPYLVNTKLRHQVSSQSMLLERQRLSHDMHDGLAQTIAAIRWKTQLIARSANDNRVDHDQFMELDSLAEKAQMDVEECLELLRSNVASGNLLLDIRDCLEHLNHDSGICCKLEAMTDKLPLSAPLEFEVLRICREALNNVRKHAQAHHVQVTVSSVDSRVEVRITDDGRGFDVVNQHQDGSNGWGLGLLVMRERADGFGGTLEVSSRPGCGTEVRLLVPLTGKAGARVHI